MSDLSQYLFQFRPLDSFSFSGDSSAKGHGSDSFANLAHDSRRQSFRVETDFLPPQTTVMGVIRRYLFDYYDIGEKSFDISQPADNMGVIKKISSIFLMGQSEGKDVVFIPAPDGITKDNVYHPLTPALFNPKEYRPFGFLCFSAEDPSVPPKWVPKDALFKTYTQPVVHIGKDSHADSYHLQCKCRLTSKDYADLHFCVTVSMDLSAKKKDAAPLPDALPPMLLPLGGRDGRFQVKCVPASFTPENVSLEAPETPEYWCLSLLSAALLPESWRTFKGLTQAFIHTRNLRCAVSDKNFQLRLIPQKMVFADTKTLFLFDTKENRDAFKEVLAQSKLTVCGLNQTLSFEI